MIKDKNDEVVCIDCSILKNPKEQRMCEELTRELAQGTIDTETFSNAFMGEVSGEQEEKSEKLLSVFCDAEENNKKEEGTKKDDKLSKG
jgi:hypothetical protein